LACQHWLSPSACLLRTAADSSILAASHALPCCLFPVQAEWLHVFWDPLAYYKTSLYPGVIHPKPGSKAKKQTNFANWKDKVYSEISNHPANIVVLDREAEGYFDSFRLSVNPFDLKIWSFALVEPRPPRREIEAALLKAYGLGKLAQVDSNGNAYASSYPSRLSWLVQFRSSLRYWCTMDQYAIDPGMAESLVSPVISGEDRGAWERSGRGEQGRGGSGELQGQGSSGSTGQGETQGSARASPRNTGQSDENTQQAAWDDRRGSFSGRGGIDGRREESTRILGATDDRLEDIPNRAAGTSIAGFRNGDQDRDQDQEGLIMDLITGIIRENGDSDTKLDQTCPRFHDGVSADRNDTREVLSVDGKNGNSDISENRTRRVPENKQGNVLAGQAHRRDPNIDDADGSKLFAPGTMASFSPAPAPPPRLRPSQDLPIPSQMYPDSYQRVKAKTHKYLFAVLRTEPGVKIDLGTLNHYQAISALQALSRADDDDGDEDEKVMMSKRWRAMIPVSGICSCSDPTR